MADFADDASAVEELQRNAALIARVRWNCGISRGGCDV